MKSISSITLILILLLTACGPAAAPNARVGAVHSPAASAQSALPATNTASSPTSAQLSASPTIGPSLTVTISQPDVAPTSVLAQTPEQVSTTSSSLDTQTINWEGLSIPIPPQHLWSDQTPDSHTINNARVLAQGRIVFDRAHAAPNSVELPDGVGFTIVQFSGSLDEWLELVQQSAPAQNPVDPNTIRTTEVAGQPAIVYSYLVTGVGDSRTYILKLSQDRLLIIDDTGYQQVIDGLKIALQ